MLFKPLYTETFFCKFALHFNILKTLFYCLRKYAVFIATFVVLLLCFNYFLNSSLHKQNNDPGENSFSNFFDKTDFDWNWSSIFATQSRLLPLCEVDLLDLQGRIKPLKDAYEFREIERYFPNLKLGGHSQPQKCNARHRVAVIVPYRDRELHLKTLLVNLHALLPKQKLDYAVFVVEQLGNSTYNKGRIMNIAFLEAFKVYDWQCIIFHDVDLLPEDSRNLYSCPEQGRPRHLGVSIDKLNYTLFYDDLFGGVTAFTKEQFIQVNGFSNEFWGWGGEDDEMTNRLYLAGFKIDRFRHSVSRYAMHKHARDSRNPRNPCRGEILKETPNRWLTDGLTNIKYRTQFITLNKLFTHIGVDLLEDDPNKMNVKNCSVSNLDM